MGLKLEFILIAFVAGLIAMALTVKISNARTKVKVQTIELEFTDTTSIEVDTKKTLSVSYGTYGVRDAGVLTIHNMQYHSSEIDMLKSDIAILKGDVIHFDHNVSVHKEAGSDYFTEHAIYNKKTGILNVTAPFKAILNENIMHGDTLRYDTRSKKANASNVDAVVFTVEK